MGNFCVECAWLYLLALHASCSSEEAILHNLTARECSSQKNKEITNFITAMSIFKQWYVLRVRINHTILKENDCTKNLGAGKISQLS